MHNITDTVAIKAEPCRKVLFVLTSHDKLGETGKPTGFHLAEMTHAYRVLKEAGYQVDFASPKGGSAPVDAGDLSDPINRGFMENPITRRQIETTQKLSHVESDDYCGVYFVGGHGTMWDFPNNADIELIVRDIYERGGVIAAICHGTSALLNVRLSDDRLLIKHKQITSFTNAEEEEVGLTEAVPFLLQSQIEQRGAKFVGGKNFAATVTVEGQLITGQNPASARGVGEEIVTYLDKARADYKRQQEVLEAI